MSEISNFEAYKKKLDGICDENNLTYRFCKDTYPISLTIRPLQGLDAQLTMFDELEEKGFTSPDAYIIFCFKDGAIVYKTSEKFTISETLFNKIKNLFKNLHSCWLQFFHRDIIENKKLIGPKLPSISEDDACNEYPNIEGSEPLEKIIDDEDLDDTEPTSEDVVNATSLVRLENKATTGLLQRRLGVSLSKAESILDILEENGVIAPDTGEPFREVLPCNATYIDTEVTDNE